VVDHYRGHSSASQCDWGGDSNAGSTVTDSVPVALDARVMAVRSLRSSRSGKTLPSGACGPLAAPPIGAAGATAGTWRDGLYVVAAAVVKTRHGCCRSRTLPRFDAMYRVHQWSRSNASRTRMRSSAVKSSPEMSTLRSRRSNEYGDVCDFTRSSAAFASFSSE